MAHIEDAIQALERAHHSDELVTISAEHARVIHALITADPAVLAANVADAAIDALFAARACFWSCTTEPDAYWYNHSRLVRAVRKIVDIGWLNVYEESVNSDSEKSQKR